MIEMSGKYLITIDGAQAYDNDQDSVSLSTIGEFSRQDDKFFISFKESAATGYEGDTTSLEIESDKKVTLNRRGVSNTQLIIERGQRHYSHYGTDFGGAMLGVRADSIENNLSDSGGKLNLRYSLDINANLLSYNSLDITVKEI